MTLPGQCQCSHEQGDSDCPVHPTCAECGASIAGHWDGVVCDLRQDVAALTVERDAAVAESKRQKTEFDMAVAVNVEWQSAHASISSERDTAAASTAEAIASWLSAQWSDAGLGEVIAGQVRAGLWRARGDAK